MENTMANTQTNSAKDNHRKGVSGTVIFHIILIILALLPLFGYQNPPPEQEGIMVNLGYVDVGQGEENAPATTQEETQEEVVEEEVQEEEPEVDPTPAKPEPTEVKDVVTTEDPEAIALKKKKEKEKAEKAAADAKKRKEAEEAKKKKAAEDAKKKAAAEAKKKAQAEADALANGLDFGSGKGKGKTNKPGNQGDPNGDPNADNLVGLSKGSGKVGGGLGSRGIRNAPKVVEKSQKAGTVVLEVCVDASGNVTKAKFTQRGSTTSDAGLVAAAKRNAKKWKFDSGIVDTQCGTITYKFKVQ